MSRRNRSRRGGAPALVLCLYLALAAVLLGAAALAAAANSAAERDYRRSQALALAEAGIAEAQADLPPHAARSLGAGSYSWEATGDARERRITAHGEVTSAGGARITRTVRARLGRVPGSWRVTAWEEGP